MAPDKSPLVIVYNADSGILIAAMHMAHKLIAPQSYPCSLCALTYGTVRMHGRWRHFLKGLDREVIFHHRDDFAAAYPAHDGDLPAILLADGNGAIRELIGASELDAAANLTELIVLVETSLAMENSRLSAG